MQLVHPKSNITIDGIELASGSVLQETDVYDSTTGQWEPIPPALAGTTLGAKHAARFVRPNAELSAAAKGLLTYLAKWNFCLTERCWWVVVPSSRWKNECWRVLHPECVAELIAHGYVQPHPEDTTVYQLTDAGREAGKRLLD